jgi:hypothetical protein
MTLEPQHLVFLLVGVAVAAFIAGRISRKCDIENANRQTASQFKQYSEACDRLRQSATRIHELTEQHAKSEKRFSELQEFVNVTLTDWKKQGALLPSLREWSDRIQVEYDEMIDHGLRTRRPRSWKAVEQIKEARDEARRYKKEAERLRPQLALYESLAPWLAEYSELTVEEILAGINEEAELKEFYKTGDDPVSLFVPCSEWASLSEAERNQLALDRYWQGSRRRTAWTAGIQYERFIGYHHEAKGYRVEYHGALFGVDDLGIDLICTKDDEVRVVQCKRLSEAKGIPVRENVIAQVYGAARYYTMAHTQLFDAIPVLYTSYECSDTARRFAQYLGVRLFERVAFQPYPCIKCNISHLSGDRIYHLPFDQQYDATVIGDLDGEFYAMTVAKAEEAGFRRAYRWTGKG